MESPPATGVNAPFPLPLPLPLPPPLPPPPFLFWSIMVWVNDRKDIVPVPAGYQRSLRRVGGEGWGGAEGQWMADQT